jgi:hypothetical protein
MMAQYGRQRREMAMKNLRFMGLLVFALVLAQPALACPDGYRVCGETGLLCCPLKNGG